MKKNPHTTVEDHGRRIIATASTISNETEYTRLWNKMIAAYAGYNDYQKNTTRRIPVVLLTPVNP